MTEEEVESLKDDEGHIRDEKVLKFLLLDFKGNGYYKWIAARVRNHMTHLIRTQGYTPTYFKSEDDKVVLGDHIACFFWGTDCQNAAWLSVNPRYVVHTGDPVCDRHGRGEHSARGV